jgi:outer membrane protein insertion porin family
LNCVLSDRPQIPLKIEAKLTLDGKSLQINPLQIDSNENSLNVNGILHHISPLKGNFEGGIQINSSLAEVFNLYLPVHGSVTAQFLVEIADANLEGHIELDSPDFILAETGPWIVHGKARLEDWTAHIDLLRLKGYSGSIESQGRIDLGRGNGEAQLLANGIDLNPLLKTWTEAVPQLATRAGANVELYFDNWQLDRNETKGELRLNTVQENGLLLSGRATLGLEKGFLSFRSNRLQILQGYCSLQGNLNTKGIDIDCELSLPATDLLKILNAFRLNLPNLKLDGPLSASGKLAGKYKNLSATASVKADELQFYSEKMSLNADLEWGQNALRVQAARFHSGQGNLEIQGTIPLGKTTNQWDLSAKMESFDLSSIVKRFGFTSSADGSFHITGPSSNPVWTMNFNSKLKNQKNPSQTATVILNAQKKAQTIAIEELRIDAGGGSLTASGLYRTDSGEIKGQLTGFGIRIQEIIELPDKLSHLEGVLSMDGDLSGTTQSPQGRLDLNLEDLSLNGVPLPTHLLGVRLEENRVEFKGSGPEPFLMGFCELDGSFQTHVELDLQQLPYNSLLVAFPTLSQYEDVSAKGLIQLDLSLKDISSLKYHADISEIKGTVDELNWSVDSFSIDGDLLSLRLNRFRYQEPYGFLSLEGSIPLNQYREMDLTIDGRVDLESLNYIVPELEMDGLAVLQLRLKGTLNQPLPIGEMSITEGKGHWRGLKWDNLVLRINGDEEQISLETLSAKVLNGELKANGNLSLPGSGSNSQIAFECNQLDVGVLLDDETNSHSTSVLLNGKGSLSTIELSLSSLNGTGQFTNILTNLGTPPISLQRPFDWTFKGGHFSHSPIQLVGEKTDIILSLDISTAVTPPDWDIQINGQLDTSAASQLIGGAGISFSGSTDIDLELTHKNGALLGQALINGGRIHLVDPPLIISQVQTQLKAKGQTLEITSLKGQISSGKIEGSGELVFEDTGTLPKADMTFIVERVPLMLSKDTYSLISGEAQLQGDSKGYTISGDIVIPRLLSQQEIDAKSESLSQLDRQLKLLEGKTSLSDLINLNLTTQIQDLRIDNSLAQLSAEGALSVSGSLSNPALAGSISIKEGGSLKLRRASVQISEGRLILNNFPENQLELDIGGITRISGVFIELRVQGPLDNLQTQLQAPYRSDLTQGDLVMLIMTGRTSQAAVDQAGTVAVEGLAGALGDALQEGVGESVYVDISPDQSFFSYDKDPTTWFSLGKEVAPNIYVIYSKDLGSARQRGVIGYLPKELPIQLRYIGEEDGRRMLEANHRLGINFQKKQKRGDASRMPLRINQLSFEGSSPIADKDLRKLAKLKPGKKYDHWKAHQGAERIRTRLIKLGYRGARVELEATPSGPEKTDVTYFIESGKRISIVWKGDQIKGKIRKEIEALWDSTTPEDILAESLRKKTVYALQAEKFYLAQVEAKWTNKEEEITVEFQVKKGLQGQRLALQFEGNEVLSDKELADALPSPSKPLFFETIDGDASSLRNILRVRYASEGYLQIEVNPIVTDYNTKNSEYLVAVPVKEGKLSTVSNIFLPQELIEAKGPNAPAFQLQVDGPFRIEEYIHDRAVLNRYYRGQGYPESRVTGILEPTADEVSVTFKVTKNIQPRVGKIRLAHPGRTHESVVRNAMTLEEGDLILPSEIARSRKRLFDTRVYQSVDIQAVESTESPEVQDLVVDLVEKKDVEVNYGLRYLIKGPSYASAGDEAESSNYSSLEIGGQLQLLNMFGYANRFGISGYLFGLQQSGRLFFETETFFGLHLPTQVYLSSEVNRELEISGLEASIQKIAFQQYYSWGETLEETRWGDKLRFQWNYSFRHINLNPFDTNIDPVNTDRGSIALSLLGDKRNSFINPTKGSFWSVTSEFARTWLGSEVNFNKLFGQGFLYVPLAENVIWVSGLRLGVVPGENPLLIIEDRFKAGGPSTVRAFRLNSLGPKNERGEPIGGQALAIFNQELRFPLYKSLHGGVFYDTGNVFLLARKARLSDLRHCAGLGLRYLLPFGPIRFDFAYVLDPKPNETRYRFVLTLGHAF